MKILWSTREAPKQHDFRGHIAELDGLRAIALGLVLIDHFWPQGLSSIVFQLGNLCWIAMDCFFVLSGFLITGILLDTCHKPGYFGAFYARRALRILPLYYLVLLIWWWIIRFTNWGHDYANMLQHWGSPAWFTFYAGNIHSALIGRIPGGSGGTLVQAYGHLWSLQIEEQYYLLFPLAVAWLSRKNLRRLLLAAVFTSPLLRVAAYLWQPGNPYLQYFLLPCHCEGLALGGLIALRFRSGAWGISKTALTTWTIFLLGAACAGSLLSTWGTRNQAWGSQWDRLAGYTVSSMACACLVLWVILSRGSRWTSWLRWAPVQYVGKISYGGYLLHQLAAWAIWELVKKKLLHFHKDDPRYFVEAIVLSLIFASLSWHFFEGPFLRLKDRIPYYRDKLRPVEIQQSGTTA